MTEFSSPCMSEHAQGHQIQDAEKRLLDGSTALRVAEFFKALSDPTRVRIISLLAQSDVCVGEICLVLGMSQPAVSHQLRVLRTMRLIDARKEGRHTFYCLSDEHVRSLFQQSLDHIHHR